MGTSSPYGGPSANTPLVPSWLQPDSAPIEAGVPSNGHVPLAPTSPPSGLPVQALPLPGRFTAARRNLSRFAHSGGDDRASLGRAVARYVSSASGGAQSAARRMGYSRSSGARLLGFLTDVRTQGAHDALRALNLEGLASQPVEEVFLGLADYVCPDSGTLDEGIARAAFIETIADLANQGITDLDSLTADQMQVVFELYATHTIEERLVNDIGTKTIVLPTDNQTAEHVQQQLRDFIRRGVSDALAQAQGDLQTLTREHVLEFVDTVYEQAFRILQAMGEAEAV